MKISITLLMKSALIIIAIATLGACTSHLSKEQCMTMNWYQVGFSDGQVGKHKRDLSGAIADCAKFEISVKADKYAQGWKAGVRQFCRPENGYQLGANGKTYNNICPADLRQAFVRQWHRGLRRYCVPNTGYNLGRSGAGIPNFCAPDQVVRFRNAYEDGRRTYQNVKNMESQISSVDSDIYSLERKLRGKQKENDKLNGYLINNRNDAGQPLDRPQRRSIRSQIRYNKDEIYQMRNQISRQKSQRVDMQYQLNRYKSQ